VYVACSMASGSCAAVERVVQNVCGSAIDGGTVMERGSTTSLSPTLVDLGSIATRGRSGAVWSLPHGGDLDANLVRLDADGAIESHVNNEVDVLIAVVSGCGHLLIDDASHDLRGDMIALVPKGARRTIVADVRGMSYLSIHRRREPLGISANPKRAAT
jgi:mannose-6-phosphate isomerase-like protein (cupin superfamily)